MFRRRWAEESTNRTVQASHSFEGMKYILPETRSESTDKPSTSLLKTSLFQLDFPAFLRDRTRTTEERAEAIATRVATNAIALTNLGPIPHLSIDPGDVSWNYRINMANVRPQ